MATLIFEDYDRYEKADNQLIASMDLVIVFRRPYRFDVVKSRYCAVRQDLDMDNLHVFLFHHESLRGMYGAPNTEPIMLIVNENRVENTTRMLDPTL